jgi:hypothetical protein
MKARRLEVVTLFRQCLRSAKRCPSFDQAEFLRIYVRRKFRDSITLRDQTLITHLIKEGVDELKTMESFHAARASREGYIPSTSIREEETNNQTLSQITLSQSSINQSRKENAKESKNEQSILTSALLSSNSNPNVQHIDDELMLRKRNAELRIAQANVRLAEALARKAEIEADKAEADAIKAESAIISELKPRN